MKNLSIESYEANIDVFCTLGHRGSGEFKQIFGLLNLTRPMLLFAAQGPGELSRVGKDNFEKGKTTMQEFCHTAGCRHAFIMQHFDPDGHYPSDGPCK